MEISINVPDNKINDWEVSTFEVSQTDADSHNLRSVFRPGSRIILPGKYKRLTRNGQVIMSNTPAEISDHMQFISKARESKAVLINGLGLGVALSAILESKIIESVTIIEKSKDVIDLISPSFSHDSRVNIIHADAFEYKPPKGVKYDAVWHDIWDNICGDNLPEITKLHRKYGRRSSWQGSWCKDLCKRCR